MSAHLGGHLGSSPTTGGPVITPPVVPADAGIGWDAVQDAIIDWIEATSGLPLGQAYWAGQDGPRSAPTPFILVTLLWDDNPGRDSVITRVVGSTITASVEGPRVLHLQLECFTDDALGDGQANAILRRILAGRQLPSVMEALIAARIGIGQIGKITLMSGVEAYQIRAHVDLDIFVSSAISEPGYVIESVKFQDDGHGTAFTVTP